MRFAGRFFGESSLCAHLTLAMILGCAMTERAFAQTVLPSPAQMPVAQPSATASPAPDQSAAPALSPSPAPVAQATSAPPSPEQPLSAEDVSWLFPAPTKAADLAKLISMGDLVVANPLDPTKGSRVWSDTIFQQFLGIAASPQAAVSGADRITLPPEAKKIEAWHIAAIRFDPGAPGLSDAIIKEYGQSPQIRLIVQPVTTDSDGNATPLDITAHLIFGFIKGAEPPARDNPQPKPQ